MTPPKDGVTSDDQPLTVSTGDGAMPDAPHPPPRTISSAGEGTSGEPITAVTDPESSFDREIDQYRKAAEELAEQERELRARLDECRDGGDLLVDYQRYDSHLRQVQARQRNLAVGRSQYIADRDRLAAWGSTEDWVVAGSIVTVRYLDGHRDTFVLTERHTDSEYETVSYSSPMGQAVRKRRVGDKVSLPAGAPLVIDSIIPGFRRPASSPAEGHPEADSTAYPKIRRTVPTAAISDEALARQRCRDKAYRDDLYRRRYDPSVRPINDYVDKLRSERRVFIPYVAPTYGGVDAQLLTLMQDPGPKTDPANADGSGMICLENVDLSAARQKFFLDEAGIRISEIVSWNAYPWPKPHPQTGRSDREAAEALRGFLMLTPNLEVVILNGAVAKRIWRVLKEINPSCVAGISSYPTFHTSERAVNPTQKSDEYIGKVHNDLSNNYAAAARQLHST
ncbi:transcription elongation GreA/GreB family factor [Rhodococcus percolatus]|nr:transcription elongation GreA/GreB family factor [Rhodococcus opacus]MBP2208496.1 transcription elongation GreA/GreB family factor [Rhodococcus opacus]